MVLLQLLGATIASCRRVRHWNAPATYLARYYSSKAAPVSRDVDPEQGFVRGGFDVSQFPPERVRNFSIIAHIDHGKSTLADRLMERTGAIKKGMQAQYLDKLQVERERGITVKAQTVSLVCHHQGADYLLNLVDTPGHVDFSYEVSRSLAACQGALLLVDASQGIQAQTVANFYLAFDQGLDLVPCVNKVDLPTADVEGCVQQMVDAFDVNPGDVLQTSAKTGLGLDQVLPAIIERVAPPKGQQDAPLRALLFDAFHDEYRGVICLAAVVDGQLAKGERICSASSGQEYEVLECGLLTPEPHATGRLLTGQVGYVITGMKNVKAARVGDTWHAAKRPVEPLPGFRPAKSMVFAGVYPASREDFEGLASAIDKLTLNDASVSARRESSDALGAGFRCGFLGMLHLEVFMQRLEQEHKAVVITTTPTVPYTLHLAGGVTQRMESAADFPVGAKTKVLGIEEPTVNATIVVPGDYVGKVMELCTSRRGSLTEHAVVGGERQLLRFVLPLSELASDLYSRLKSVSQGYASFDYEEGQYRAADLARLDILVNGQVVDALARMVHVDRITQEGRALCSKLKSLLDQQQFEVAIQAAANGHVIARETIKAYRKNVLAKCYGGDVSRKRKLLEKQREGKRRMSRLGSLEVPQDVFPELMRTR